MLMRSTYAGTYAGDACFCSKAAAECLRMCICTLAPQLFCCMCMACKHATCAGADLSGWLSLTMCCPAGR